MTKHAELTANSRLATKEEIESQNNSVIEQIACICHMANRSYCHTLGDDSQPKWADAPDWMKESAIAGVHFVLGNPLATPEDSHESWYRHKVEDGWKYGPVKDPEKKEHPCMVAYHELPYEQQVKDSIFQGIARAMLKKAIRSGKLTVNRPLTPGEEVMNVQFNPGGHRAVADIKEAFAHLHDLLEKEGVIKRTAILNAAIDQLPLEQRGKGTIDTPPAVSKVGRLMAVALTHIETAQMYAVKAVTR